MKSWKDVRGPTTNLIRFNKPPPEFRVRIVIFAVKQAISQNFRKEVERYDFAARGELLSVYVFKAGICPYSLVDETARINRTISAGTRGLL